MEEPDPDSRLTAEEPEGFTQVPDSLLLNQHVSDGAYRLYAVLKHHARQSSSAWPKRKTLADELGVKSRRTVDSRIDELVDAGYLVVRPRYRADGGRAASDYHLLFYPRVPSGGPVADDEPPGNEVHQGPAQPVAQGGGKNLRRGGAAGSTRPEQGAAHQRSRPTSSRPRSSRRNPNPPSEAPPAPSPTRPGRVGSGGGIDPETLAWANGVIGELPSQLYPSTRQQFDQLVDLLAAHTPLHATPARDLACRIATCRPLPEVVTHPVGLVRTRLEEIQPAKPARSSWRTSVAWCGSCDAESRMASVTDHGREVLRRCPDCHPAAAGGAA